MLIRLQFEVVYLCGGQHLLPLTIENDQDVIASLNVTTISIQHRTPFYMTVQKNVLSDYHSQIQKIVPKTVPIPQHLVTLSIFLI